MHGGLIRAAPGDVKAQHLIRAATRFVSYQDRKSVAAALRPIYTAPTVEAAEAELLAKSGTDPALWWHWRSPQTGADWVAGGVFLPYPVGPGTLGGKGG